MKFKYLQNMYVPMVLTQDTSQQHVAGINSQYTHVICTTKFLLPAAHILVCISVFVHASCCCEMLILQFDPLCVSQFLCFMHLVVFVTSYICHSLSQPAKRAS